MIIVCKSNMDTVAFPPNVRSTTISFGPSFAVSIFFLRSFNREDLGFRLFDKKLSCWSFECLLMTVIMSSWSFRSVWCWERMLSRSSWNWQFHGIGPSKSNGNSDSFVGTKDVSATGAWYDCGSVTALVLVELSRSEKRSSTSGFIVSRVDIINITIHSI
jgi:hypothetical protein